MENEPRDRTLEYRGKAALPARRWEDAEYWRWLWARVAFRVVVILLVCPITFYFGPNLINFGMLTSLVPKDFAPMVEREAVPTVRAIKEYERDNGRLPERIEDVVPRYLPSVPYEQLIVGSRFTYVAWLGGMHDITYELAGGDGVWHIDGRSVRGRIPVPPVTIGPGTSGPAMR